MRIKHTTTALRSEYLSSLPTLPSFTPPLPRPLNLLTRQKKFYGERLKRLFFTHTKEWVRSVVRRGTLVISQVSLSSSWRVPFVLISLGS
jgi:hypothetical protein